MDDFANIKRAQDAALVMDNPAYKEAMQLLKESVVQKWRDCPIRDREGQLLYLQLAKLTDTFESLLNGFVQNGRLSQQRIEDDKIRNETIAKRWLRKVG
jgi:hypothetical protein